jgi:hypothetical protein
VAPGRYAEWWRMAALSDELLKRIIEGSGRVYAHEAKAMAAEIVQWRERAKKAAQTSASTSAGSGMWTPGMPYP